MLSWLSIAFDFIWLFFRLNCCKLSERSCETLSSVLSYQSSHLRDLDLSNNDLKDRGVKLLSEELKTPHCTLETLKWDFFSFFLALKKVNCISLFVISLLLNFFSFFLFYNLNCEFSNHKCNKLLLNVVAPNYTMITFLKQCPSLVLVLTLSLSLCSLSEISCEALSSVISSMPSSLRGLDLSNNDLLDSGVKLLSLGMKSPHCKLEVLW